MPSDCSWAWQKLLKLRDLVESHILCMIGNMNSTKLWLDRWHSEGVLLKRYGERIRYVSGFECLCNVSTILQDGDWYMEVARSTSLINTWQSLDSIDRLRVDEQDRVIWMASSLGVLTSRTALNLVRTSAPTVVWHEVVWCTNNIPRHSFVAWRVLTNRLPTQSRLCKLGILRTS